MERNNISCAQHDQIFVVQQQQVASANGRLVIQHMNKTNQQQLTTDLDLNDVQLELQTPARSSDAIMGDEKWRNKSWRLPSCVPVTIILSLVILLVVLPFLDEKISIEDKKDSQQYATKWATCHNSCRASLVESIPEGLAYRPSEVIHSATYDTWQNLLQIAEKSIEIASLYWTLKGSDVYPYPSAHKGEEILHGLMQAGVHRGIKIRIAQNAPTPENPNLDTEFLEKHGAAEVRSLNFQKLVGGGVLHTKFWLIDRKHAYVGSANMDWRSLTEVKEMGVAIYNCSCLASDLGKIFDVYWYLGKEGATVPSKWPDQFGTKFNRDHPMNLTFNATSPSNVFISSSPPQFCPKGRTSDIDTVLDVIGSANQFIHIAVMDYFPLTIYTPKIKHWPVIDDALRSAAVDRKVTIKLLVSHWNHTRPSMKYFLESLTTLTQSFPWVRIEAKFFEVPSSEAQSKIPFARVNHNKYMVTDNTAYIGTSNWSGDYFINTGGAAVVVRDPNTELDDALRDEESLRQQLVAVFDRDWNSPYAVPISQK
ncbi:5'-3' exonuclease PLD3 isoform X2 [Neocloeon triangulifer]|uniref:5'-3' exonuclease PLD3 isoform X2 n=1 Tax=Neocloeon triangulifer TaxID=2078957 RepID=UPI00286EB9BA|nr:5'-3' exonuclease PLD3 isoform X2 [Neocloeon triangulifer]